MHRSKNILIFLALLLLCSCAGTIKTVKSTGVNSAAFKKAYIISPENSYYIKFRMGAVTPWGYIKLPEKPAEKTEKIGSTEMVIKNELEKNGVTAEIGKEGTIPEGFDLIVIYKDEWRWDFKKVLNKLEIVFVSPNNEEIARSTFNIYKNKELHNFPTPEKEVPKMIKQLLNK